MAGSFPDIFLVSHLASWIGLRQTMFPAISTRPHDLVNPDKKALNPKPLLFWGGFFFLLYKGRIRYISYRVHWKDYREVHSCDHYCDSYMRLDSVDLLAAMHCICNLYTTDSNANGRIIITD